MNQILSDLPATGNGRTRSAQSPKRHSGATREGALAPHAAARGGALGTNAKYGARDPMAARVERFALQSVARAILPTSRTAKCLRLRSANPNSKADGVAVWKSKDHGTTHYSGLQTCGSVWTCPVCAAKISERRRAEVLAAMTAHKAAGGCVNLLTLTAPHQRTDDLVELLDKQAAAVGSFWKDLTVRKILAEMGTVGQIRAWEVTHGRKSAHNNGWHPHFHVLLFSGSGVDLARFDVAQMKDWAVRLYLRWAAKCKAAGLGEPSFKHGLKLDDGSKAAAYAAKWGLEDEITRGHTKKGKEGGETPFDLLRAFLADKSDKQAAALFQVYAGAFKGKRQLHWSAGLKARYAIDEASDDEVCQRIEEQAELLGLLTVNQWRDVLSVDARAVVLRIASAFTWADVLRFLDLIESSHHDQEHKRRCLEIIPDFFSAFAV